MRGSFHVSQVTAGRKNRIALEIAGTEGALSWDSETPNRLWVGRRNEPNQLLERDPALLSPAAAALTHYPGGHAEGFPDTFKHLYLAIYGWVGSGGDVHLPISPPSKTATAKSGSARPSRSTPATQRWVDVGGDH